MARPFGISVSPAAWDRRPHTCFFGLNFGELLGFADVSHGDITLTPLGEAFAEASIVGRKDIFATRLRRLPLFKWLLSLLNASEGHRQKWEVIHTRLLLDFHQEEAARQLDTAIDWGRYAELLAYDDKTRVIFLELGGAENHSAAH